MKYQILKSKLTPAYDKHGERERAEGHPAFRVEWETVGQVEEKTPELAIEAAKRVTAAPVLEVM